MLAKRIVVALDIKDGYVVKGIKFKNIKKAGDPVALAKIYEKEGADELVFLDIAASSEKRSIMLNTVKKVASSVFIPLTVGGGVKTVEDAKKIIKNGADKIFINTQAVIRPEIVTEAAKEVGTANVVIAIDAKWNGCYFEVYTHGGNFPTKKDAAEWAREAEERGAGEILLTSMDRDGTKQGFDLKLLEYVLKKTEIPIIISGGAGKKEHFLEAFESGASAALAASIFHYGEIGIKELKLFLKEKGTEVRI